jgi:hypothetical protein
MSTEKKLEEKASANVRSILRSKCGVMITDMGAEGNGE